MATASDTSSSVVPTAHSTIGFNGGCTCGAIRYRLLCSPLFVHCCHCTWCQRETGSAFVVNAIIEASNMSLLPPKSSVPAPSQDAHSHPVGTSPLKVLTPSYSGVSQLVVRCPHCYIAVWSEYDGVSAMRFVRVGTLDNPGTCRPSIHIFTASKQDWVDLKSEKERGVKVYEEYYEREKEWSSESLKRRELISDLIEREYAISKTKQRIQS